MFNALERLRRLRAGLPINPVELESIEITTGRSVIVSSNEQVTITSWMDLPADWRVDFEERAAIREYDGGQAREHAEAEALAEILAQIRNGPAAC